MNYKFILALDPSGNYHEGKGTTGWSIFNAADKRITLSDSIFAGNFPSMEAYWDAQVKLISKYLTRYDTDMVLVIEDYLLYENRAKEQVNSKMETPKLIGVLQYFCYLNNLHYIMQPASEVKTRWTNDILLYKNYIGKGSKNYHLPGSKEPINRHCLDSIRHAVHYATFKNTHKE